MIRPEPDFLRSFDALERSIRTLPRQETILPPPVPPDPHLLDAWLSPYRTWKLPAVYLDYLAHYGGVTTNVPPVGIGIKPLAALLDYRRKREAIGEVFETRFILLSFANIDGNLCLVFSRDDAEPRVALMNGDDDILYEADSFAMYLWSSCFFLGAIHEARFQEYISFTDVPPQEIEPFNLRLAAELERAGFELLGADTRTICCQRGETCVRTGMRGPNIGVSLGNRGSLHAVTEARADLLALLERNR
jgi:hypothetical protein